MIQYLQGDATQPYGCGIQIIAHVCNDVGAWGAGFTSSLVSRWPRAQATFEAWVRKEHAGSDPPYILGSTLIRSLDDWPPELYIAHMVAQEGLPYSGGRPPIRYGYLHDCLETVRRFALNNLASVHMPRIGCGLARGKWELVEPIINATLIAYGVKTFVYDLPTQ